MLQRWSGYLPSTRPVFSPEGAVPQITEAVRCHRDLGDSFDSIVAIGGGRIIDTAKAISLGSKELTRFADDPSYELRGDARIPLVAIPTIAGSGSEVTPFAVAYRQGIKQSIRHPALAPVAAVIDPQLAATVPRLQRAVSGLDAIAHGIEALLSNRASEASDLHGRKAVEIGCKALFKPPDNLLKQLTELCWASVSGGMAIATTTTTIPHAMSYYFTSVHGVPHGHAVALTMGRYLHRFGAAMQSEKRLRKWSESYEYILHQLGARSHSDVEQTWYEHLACLGITASLSSLGITIDMDVLRQHVNRDRFANSPLQMSVAEAKTLLVDQ